MAFQKLRKTLLDELETIEELLRAGDKLLKSLKDNNQEQIYSALQQQNVLLDKLNHLEKKCIRIQNKMKEGLALSEEVNLSRLISLAPDGLREKLKSLQERLVYSAKQLQKINRSRRIAFKRAAQLSGQLNRVISARAAKDETYSSFGFIQARQKGTISLDREI